MSAILRAAVTTLFMLEISSAFFLGFVTLVLLGLHITGIVFWSVEALTAIGALYLCGLFFMSALKYEREAQMVEVRAN